MMPTDFRQTLFTFLSHKTNKGCRVSEPCGRALRNFDANRMPLAALVLLLAWCTGGWTKHSDHVQEMPFKLYQDHVVIIAGSLGGSEQRNLLIDTGTNPTVVDIAVAHELGLDHAVKQSGTLSVVDGVVQSYYAVLPRMEFGPVHQDSMTVAVTNLSWIREKIGIRVDAVIGWDALAEHNFQINYESRKISFGDVRMPKQSVPVVEGDRLLMVNAQLNGETVKLMVDTGGSGLVLFANELPKSSSWLTLGTTSKLSNLAGQSMLREVQLKELRIGGTNLDGTIASIAGKPTCCKVQGVLGVSAVQFKRIVFDLEQRRVGFELRDQSAYEAVGVSPCGASYEATLCRDPSTPSRQPLPNPSR